MRQFLSRAPCVQSFIEIGAERFRYFDKAKNDSTLGIFEEKTTIVVVFGDEELETRVEDLMASAYTHLSNSRTLYHIAAIHYFTFPRLVGRNMLGN
jgi:hypothetical protein